MPHLFGLMGSGVQIMVAEEDVSLASEIIESNDLKIHCPDCRSQDVINNIEERKSWFTVLMLLLFLGAPAGNLMTAYTCKQCGFKFKR